MRQKDEADHTHKSMEVEILRIQSYRLTGNREMLAIERKRTIQQTSLEQTAPNKGTDRDLEVEVSPPAQVSSLNRLSSPLSAML